MKLNAYALGSELKALGYDFYSGVPCSFLSNLINYAINEVTFIMSNNEGDAVATCAGAYLGGKKTVVLMQNSGLTNAVSPLTSLNYSFKIPVLGFVSLRGEEGINDEPQHELMGQVTEKMLELMDVEWEYLSTNLNEVKAQLLRADDCINRKKPFFFVVKKGTLDKVELDSMKLNQVENKQLSKQTKEDERPSRQEILERLSSDKNQKTVLLATTGKTGRELFEIADSKSNLYMVGSMGCISAMGLGLSLSQSKNVIAIDGDGALLMRMGNMVTNAYYSPNNLLHILIDNNLHDSTGGQFTASHNVDFIQLAASSAYTNSIYAHSLDELSEILKNWQANPVLTFVYIKARKGTKEGLGRPTITPEEIKMRLMSFIQE